MRELFNFLGGRKLVGFICVFGLTTWATIAQYEIPANNVDLLKWIGGVYMASNAAVALATALKEKKG